MSYLVLFFFLCFFSPFSIAITSHGEERANLSAFCTFVRFVLVWFCLFPLPLGVWKGLRFVIVALPLDFSLTIFASFKSVKNALYHAVESQVHCNWGGWGGEEHTTSYLTEHREIHKTGHMYEKQTF